MKTSLTGAMGLCLWLAAFPAVAQIPNPPKNTGKPPPVAAPVATPPPAPEAAAANPAELTHQAIVEEQKRRDREAEAERERDDL